MADLPYAVHDRAELARRISVPLVVRRLATLRQQACWIAVRYLLEVTEELVDPVTVAREVPTMHRDSIPAILAELVALGLLHHYGTVDVAGKKNLRTLYTIPHAYLHHASIALAKRELAASGRRYLTSVAVDPDRLVLDLGMGLDIPGVPARPLTEIPDAAVHDILGRVVETSMPLVVRRRVGLYPQMCWLAMSAMIERGDQAVGTRTLANELATRSYPRVAGWIEELCEAGLVSVIGKEKIRNLADRRVFVMPWEMLLNESWALAKEELAKAERRYRVIKVMPLVTPSDHVGRMGSQTDPASVTPSDHVGRMGSHVGESERGREIACARTCPPPSF